MAKPNPDYRENPRRAIYVQGPINEGLVSALTPKINELRLEDASPITLYVNSPGGSTAAAEVIWKLVTAPNPDGKQCRMITVVTGTAASAAADLLALGDYAIAYSHARILYHGTRITSQNALTTEDAASLASSLKQGNEFYAGRLANSAFNRFFLRLLQFKDQFERYRNLSKTDVSIHSLGPLAQALRHKLSPLVQRAVTKALHRQQTIVHLARPANKRIGRFKNQTKLFSTSQFEAEMLKAIVDARAREHKGDTNYFSLHGGLQEVADDFEQLNDYYFGKLHDNLRSLIRLYGAMLLTDADRGTYAGLSGSQDDKAKWLDEYSRRKLLFLWHLMVTLCRILQTEDHDLTPIEAYWIGLVDEVPGSGLANVREMIESPPKASPKRQPKSPTKS